jgi:hypothetical protein
MRDDDEQYQDEETPKGKVKFIESKNISVSAPYRGMFVVRFPDKLKIKDIELTPELRFNGRNRKDEYLRSFERLYRLGYNEKAYIKAERARTSKEKGSRIGGTLRLWRVRVWTGIKGMPVFWGWIIGAAAAGGILVETAKWVWKHFSR